MLRALATAGPEHRHSPFQSIFNFRAYPLHPACYLHSSFVSLHTTYGAAARHPSPVSCQLRSKSPYAYLAGGRGQATKGAGEAKAVEVPNELIGWYLETFLDSFIHHQIVRQQLDQPPTS